MPRLLALDELTHDHHSWWYDSYGSQADNSTLLRENIVAVAGIDDDVDPTYPRAGMDGGVGSSIGIIHAPLHPRYSHHLADHTLSSVYESSYYPPPGPDNRSTIFRGRGGGRPISRSEYPHPTNTSNSNNSYYSYYQPPPLLPQQFPSPPTNNDEQRQDTCNPDRIIRKRDRSIDCTPMDLNDDQYDNYYSNYRQHYRSAYAPPPPVIMSSSSHRQQQQRYFEPESSTSSTNTKRHCNTTNNHDEKSSAASAWNINSPTTAAVNHHQNEDTKEKKFNPSYPHLAEKLTWQQSFENLLVYKESYGDCNVPQKYKENPKLGGWVNKQRKKKKNPIKYGRLTEQQTNQLNEVGFKWNLESPAGLSPASNHSD